MICIVILIPESLCDMDTNAALISGFRRDVDVICGLLGNYTTPCNCPKDHRLQMQQFAEICAHVADTPLSCAS
jgi:hypothetical protein